MTDMVNDPSTETIEVQIPGGSLVADRAGPGGRRTVVLLHGFPQTRYTWRHQLPALAKAGYQALAPDQRGYSAGLRPAAVEEYHVDNLIGDVLALSDWLTEPANAGDGNGHPSDGRIDLVGHDWGGQVAWLTAARHPDRIRSLTVLSRPHPAAFAASFAADPAQAERSKHHRRFDDPATADLLLADGERRLRRTLASSGVPDADIDGYLEVLADRAALDAALHWYRAATGGGLRAADTPVVEVPTLYLWGNDDASVGRTAAEATAAHVSAPYRFVEIEGGGHFLTDDGASDTVTDTMLDHLNDS